MKVFLAIAEHGNLMDAAQVLNLNHSTIFRRLNDFEDKIGSNLFDRIGGRYELTELGEELLQLANPVANCFDDIERHIIGKDMKPQGTVKITAPTGFAFYHLPLYVEEFSNLYPDIKLEILVSDQEIKMNNRHADIALRATANPPEFLVGRMIKEIKWAFYASQSYIDKHGKPDDINDLSNHLLVGAAGNLNDMEIYSWLDKKYKKNIVCRSDHIIAMSHLAGEGLGLIILPDDLKTEKLKRLFTFESATANKLWILVHPDLRKVERIKIVMKFFAERLLNSSKLF